MITFFVRNLMFSAVALKIIVKIPLLKYFTKLVTTQKQNLLKGVSIYVFYEFWNFQKIIF